jgi:HSP20 family protein
MQEVPVKLFRTPDRLAVAAPMPGLLPEDIAIEVTPDNRLILHGALRGVPADLQIFHHPAPARRSDRSASKVVEERRELVLDEWTVGSYHRELELPVPVNGRLATATYGNGVLVVALPIAKKVVPAHIHLEPVGVSRGERVGSTGHPVKRVSTKQHVSAAHPPEGT